MAVMWYGMPVFSIMYHASTMTSGRGLLIALDTVSKIGSTQRSVT